MPGRFRVEHGVFAGSWYRSAGTGYTGERGAEIAVPAENGAELFRALIAAGATPVGLGARDTLRLEMGYPLWGQDLDEGTTPLEAGLGWVVSWDHGFVGRGALIRQEEEGLRKQLVGFQTEGRAIPRNGYRLRRGSEGGTVTSGNFSPSLGRGIGLGYIAVTDDDPVDLEVEIRSRWLEVEEVEPPFLSR
jgi:aminomethyltransferase